MVEGAGPAHWCWTGVPAQALGHHGMLAGGPGDHQGMLAGVPLGHQVPV